MKKEVFIIICGALFLAMLVIALFNHPAVQVATAEALHEVKTADIWHGVGFQQPIPNSIYQQGNVPYTSQGAVAPVAFPYPNGTQSYYPNYQVQPSQQAALATPLIPILDTQDKPVLIKHFGCEVVEVTGGKIKITGVMGMSWAEKAGLKPGDILLNFNTKEITDLKQFQAMVLKAPPEGTYKIVYLRNGQKKKGVITIGEGEMDGFLPIVPQQGPPI